MSNVVDLDMARREIAVHEQIAEWEWYEVVAYMARLEKLREKQRTLIGLYRDIVAQQDCILHGNGA
jgi:hypothetical protein